MSSANLANINLFVNGNMHSIKASPDASLLSVLRHDLGLGGARIGCGLGNCGACTVLVDGRAMQACNTPLWSVGASAVVTLEAHETHAQLQAVRDAFLEEQAAQCGYCINGIMASVAALIMQSPMPTRADIIAVLDERHLCRCGAHPRILRAVDRLLAAQPVSAS